LGKNIVDTNAMTATQFKQNHAVVPNLKREKHNGASRDLPMSEYRRLSWDDPHSTQANAFKKVVPTREPFKLVRWPPCLTKLLHWWRARGRRRNACGPRGL